MATVETTAAVTTTFAMATETKATTSSETTHTNHLLSKENKRKTKGSYVWDSRRFEKI
jgi:hypothetical protein